MTEKSEALKLAEQLEKVWFQHEAAAELRRLHSDNKLICSALNGWIRENSPGGWIDDLRTQRNALLEALNSMIDLAEFWINHRQERHMSEQEYKVWIALGHESNAMLKARAAIKAVEGE